MGGMQNSQIAATYSEYLQSWTVTGLGYTISVISMFNFILFS